MMDRPLTKQELELQFDVCDANAALRAIAMTPIGYLVDRPNVGTVFKCIKHLRDEYDDLHADISLVESVDELIGRYDTECYKCGLQFRPQQLDTTEGGTLS